jgi:hypothetical protein
MVIMITQVLNIKLSYLRLSTFRKGSLQNIFLNTLDFPYEIYVQPIPYLLDFTIATGAHDIFPHKL